MSAAPLDVVVCAHDEAAILPRLLDALLAQTAPRESFRVLVVDNASRDGTADVARAHAGSLALEVVEEPRLGKNRACNAGYRHARSDYVGHLDADTVPDPRWVATVLAVVAAERPDVLGGRLVPIWEQPPPPWLPAATLDIDLGGTAGPTEHAHRFGGGNLVWRRAVVEEVGGFAEDVGLVGRGLARGDETELVFRAQRLVPGLRTWYEPRLVVRHRVPAAAYTRRHWLGRSLSRGHLNATVRGEAAPPSVERFARAVLRLGAHSVPALVRRSDPTAFARLRQDAFDLADSAAALRTRVARSTTSQ